MPPTLNALLKKQDLTSRDAGLILMYYAKATLEGKRASLPITAEDVAAFMYKVRYRPDIDKLNTLEKYYDVIRDQRERAYDNTRRIAGGANLIRLYAKNFDDHSKQDLISYSLPLTLTDNGYNFYAAATKTAKEQKKYSFYEIFARYLYFTYRLFIKEPIILSTETRAAFYQAQEQSITCKSIKEHYSTVFCEWAIVDKLHPEGLPLTDIDIFEYMKTNLNKHKISKAEAGELLDNIAHLDKLYFENNAASMLEFIKSSTDFVITQGEIEKLESGELDIMDFYPAIIREFENNEAVPAKLEFKPIKKEMPATETIFSLLETAVKATDDKKQTSPTGLLFINDDRTPTKQIKELKQNAPYLFKAICDKIRQDIPQLNNLDEPQLLKASIIGKEIKKLCLEPIRDDFENVTFSDIQQYVLCSSSTSYQEKQQAKNGIALLTVFKENGNMPYYVSKATKRGRIYNPPTAEIKPTMQEFEKLDLSDTYTREFYKPLSMVFAYNAFIDICNKALNIPFMDCAKMIAMPFINLSLSDYNRDVYKYYRNIAGEPKERKKRRDLYKSLFIPIDQSLYIPDQMIIEQYTADFSEAISRKEGADWIKQAPAIIKAIAETVYS